MIRRAAISSDMTIPFLMDSELFAFAYNYCAAWSECQSQNFHTGLPRSPPDSSTTS